MTKPEITCAIGAFLYNQNTRTLYDATGTEIDLRPQTKDVLAVLVRHANNVVSKQDLMDEVWADVSVTDDSLVQCISEIRKALGPNDKGGLQTVPRKGYRLVVRGHPVKRRTIPKIGWPMAAGLAAVFVTIAAFVMIGFDRPAFWRQQGPTTQITIAVLPFRNMSGDPAHDYLSNGLAEDLIVSLSSLSDLRVLSRGTTFSVSQEGQDLRDVAEFLRADYVTEGSLWHLGETVRISIALVKGDNGAVIWARQFEGDANDVLLFQESVLEDLIHSLSIRLSRSERQRLGIIGTKSAAAHDFYLRGREFENLYTRETNLAAEIALLDAIKQDPGFALAYAHLSQVYSFRVENQWSDTRDSDISRAFVAAHRALELDADLPFAHFTLGRLYTRSFSPDSTQAGGYYERAIELDPNYVDAYVFLANVHIFNGDATRAMPLITASFARNSTPPYWYYLAEGMAHYFLGNYGDAEKALLTARDQNPTAPFPYRFLMATYGMLGNQEEAEWMAMEYEALGRVANIKDLLLTASIQDPAYRMMFEQGFRLAGLPEG